MCIKCSYVLEVSIATKTAYGMQQTAADPSPHHAWELSDSAVGLGGGQISIFCRIER
jgi:hypothetical protein